MTAESGESAISPDSAAISRAAAPRLARQGLARRGWRDRARRAAAGVTGPGARRLARQGLASQGRRRPYRAPLFSNPRKICRRPNIMPGTD